MSNKPFTLSTAPSTKFSNILKLASYYTMNKGNKFLKKLWFCVGEEYYKIIWFYQLG